MKEYLYFYVEDERTVGRLDFTPDTGANGENQDRYENGKILRGGKWVKIHAAELITSAKPIDKAEAERLVGADAIATE